jgi:hypothetical protein
MLEARQGTSDPAVILLSLGRRLILRPATMDTRFCGTRRQGPICIPAGILLQSFAQPITDNRRDPSPRIHQRAGAQNRRSVPVCRIRTENYLVTVRQLRRAVHIQYRGDLRNDNRATLHPLPLGMHCAVPVSQVSWQPPDHRTGPPHRTAMDTRMTLGARRYPVLTFENNP